MNIILSGITGSRAYGLDTESSDTDIKGIFVSPTRDVLGLFPPKETIDQHEPDRTWHEVGKFVKLALSGNPSILEMLYLEGYTELSKHGKMLVDNRHLFLSNIIYKSYGGYAIAQVRKMNARGGEYGNGMKNRYSKNTRHTFRLLQQGKELLETGTLTVRVNNRDELFEIGELPPDKVVDRFEKAFAEFDKIKSILPDKPDTESINKLLLKIRKAEW